jgi:hypothetical protein
MGEGERMDVFRVLEEAGARHLAGADPKTHGVFLMHVGCAQLFPPPDSETFWRTMQAILDHFFDPPERAEICARLLECGGLVRCEECRSFVATALAERRLQAMMAATWITPPAAAC